MSSPDAPTLARRIGLFSLIVYGVGDMVGAGIYGTIGVAAGVMGNAVWLAFVVSMVAALLTGFSYASLGSRYPKAGGAAYITQRAFGMRFLSYVVGLAVAASGLTSMAAGTDVFATNLGVAIPSIPVWSIAVGFLLLLAAINLIGIKESLTANLVCTAIEVGGLVLVIIVGARYWGGDVDYLAVPAGSTLGPSMLLSGAVLTFYAFVGFEDMLNVAEEVKSPEKNMPWGIILAVVTATVLYILVSVTAVSVVTPEKLANAENGPPLTQIMNVAAPWLPGWVYSVITLFAVANTALLNYIMGSRLLYGMANQGLVPRPLSKVHPRFRTPYVSVLTLGIIVLVLTFAGDISQLASATSLLLLTCFCLINLALIVLKARPDEPKGRMEIPYFVPALGVLVCGGLIFARLTAPNADPRAPQIAIALIILIAALYFVLRPKNVGVEEE
ncbi:MAG TPA: APC family permease [Chthoniobacteraceae bacterium]|nr:APC family permease [Chthoniobacteraceae bacterium]